MIWLRSRPTLSLRAYWLAEDGGPAMIIPSLIGLASTAASLALRPKIPKPPTPPSPSQDIARPSPSFLAPGQGSFNGTFFGGASSAGSSASPSGSKVFGA